MNPYIHHRLISRAAKKFGADPAFQYKLHLIATYVWVLNMVVALTVFALLPGAWAHWSVLYLVMVSLYANFATDYGAVPASMAAMHAKAMHEEGEHQ